jgi:hypothetical protein
MQFQELGTNLLIFLANWRNDMKKTILFIMLSVTALAGDYRILLGNDLYLIEFNSKDRAIIDVPRHLTLVDTDITLIGKSGDHIYGMRLNDTKETWFILTLGTKIAKELSNARDFLAELKRIGITDGITLQEPIFFAGKDRAARAKEASP